MKKIFNSISAFFSNPKEQEEPSIDINRGLNKLKLNVFLHNEIHKRRPIERDLQTNRNLGYEFKNGHLATFFNVVLKEIDEFDEAYFALLANLDNLEVESKVLGDASSFISENC